MAHPKSLRPTLAVTLLLLSIIIIIIIIIIFIIIIILAVTYLFLSYSPEYITPTQQI